MAKRDLRSIKKNKSQGLTRDDVKEAAKKARVNIGDVNETDIHSMEETIAKYEDKSEGELMSDLEQMISDGRNNGTFSDDMLDSFIRNVSPMMDTSQKKKLESIARMIRNKKT